MDAAFRILRHRVMFVTARGTENAALDIQNSSDGLFQVPTSTEDEIEGTIKVTGRRG